MPARWGAIGACLVVFAAGCGTQAAETPAAAEEAAVAALDARISGTAQQQVDGMFLDYVKMQDDLVQCFAAFGATYQPSPFGQAERPQRPGQLSAPVPVAMSVDLNEISARLDESIEQRLAGLGYWTGPIDGVLDSMQEEFALQLPPTAGEHLVVFRCYDSANNAGLAKIVVR